VAGFSRDRRADGAIEDKRRELLDTLAARSVREAVVRLVLAQGDEATAMRLMLPGVEGYPGMDELQYIAQLLGGSVELRKPSVPNSPLILYGSGPVAASILHASLADGAGHTSDHFILGQSWMRVEGSVPPAVRTLEEDLLSVMDRWSPPSQPIEISASEPGAARGSGSAISIQKTMGDGLKFNPPPAEADTREQSPVRKTVPPLKWLRRLNSTLGRTR
jgi:hypothetical protein